MYKQEEQAADAGDVDDDNVVGNATEARCEKLRAVPASLCPRPDTADAPGHEETPAVQFGTRKRSVLVLRCIDLPDQSCTVSRVAIFSITWKSHQRIKKWSAKWKKSECVWSGNLCNVLEVLYTVSQKKLDPFSFEHNFGKYCTILIILSLLQTEINCDKVYHKIYHHTSNLLVHYLVK